MVVNCSLSWFSIALKGAIWKTNASCSFPFLATLLTWRKKIKRITRGCTNLSLADGDGVLVHDPQDVLGVGGGGEGAVVGVVAGRLQVGDNPGQEVGVNLNLLGVLSNDLGDGVDELLEVGVPVVVNALGTKESVNREESEVRLVEAIHPFAQKHPHLPHHAVLSPEQRTLAPTHRGEQSRPYPGVYVGQVLRQEGANPQPGGLPGTAQQLQPGRAAAPRALRAGRQQRQGSQEARAVPVA
ncbi:Carbonic anhydrase 2 [Frankliniella occidentalis]|nr:Carbonic anhydrase 2 [Frankliniella occidentalis]